MLSLLITILLHLSLLLPQQRLRRLLCLKLVLGRLTTITLLQLSHWKLDVSSSNKFLQTCYNLTQPQTLTQLHKTAHSCLLRLLVDRFHRLQSCWSSVSCNVTSRSVDHLDRLIQFYHHNALLRLLCPPTILVYEHYYLFCAQTGLSRFPLSETNLQRFVVFVANRLGYKSIKVYLAGIQFFSIMYGYNVALSSFPRLFICYKVFDVHKDLNFLVHVVYP